MRKILLGLGLTMMLSGCASPAAVMSPQEISTLSNQQLCSLKNSYGWEQKTEIEIGRRNLNCDPIFNECANRGIKPNTSEMALCMNQTRQTLALENQVNKQQQVLEKQLERQQRELEIERGLNNLQRMKQSNQQRQQPQPAHQPQFCSGFPFCN